MKKVKIIRKYGLDDEPWTRQELIDGWNQELIKRSKVTVFGAGAMGNEIVKNLVLLGVSNIKVVDFDYVDYSNLSRSVFFRREDAKVKRKKVEAIIERAQELDPYGYIDVKGYFLDIEDLEWSHEVFRDADVLFSAVDSLETRLHINFQAYYIGKPLIDGGMEAGLGYVQVVVPPYTSCIACSLHQRDMKILMERLSCVGLPQDMVTPKTPAVITTTSIIAGIMVHEFIKIIHGIDMFRKEGRWNMKIGEPLAGKRLYINLTHNIYLISEIPISDKCPIYKLHLRSINPTKYNDVKQ